MNKPREDNHPDGEAGRYASARGWDPNDKYEAERSNLLADHRRRHPEESCTTSIFETRPANEVMQDAVERPKNAQLFGDLWRQGELAVLVGETGVGKSVLAVQIAESIARGRAVEPFGKPSPQPVLYIDFERTDAQFSERYSVRTPANRIRKYKFSEQFERTAFGEDIHVPEPFNGDLARYMRHSFNLELGRTDARVLIIDSLAYLDPKSTRNAAVPRLRALKLLAMTTGLSILVITSAKPRRVGSPHVSKGSCPNTANSSLVTRPLSLADLPCGAEIASITDSVFAIGRSTFGPDFRYIKHLKATATPPLYHSQQVLAYQLGRVSSPHVSTGSSLATEMTERPRTALITTAGEQVEFVISPNAKRAAGWLCTSTPSNCVGETRNTKRVAAPFLGFRFLGTCDESAAIHDYAAEAQARLDAESKRLKRIRDPNGSVVEMLMSSEYKEYLERY